MFLVHFARSFSVQNKSDSTQTLFLWSTATILLSLSNEMCFLLNRVLQWNRFKRYYSLYVFRARAGPEVFTSPCPATRITVGGDDTPKCTCSRPTIKCRTTWKEPFACSGGSSVWSRREEDTGLGEETTCG